MYSPFDCLKNIWAGLRCCLPFCRGNIPRPEGQISSGMGDGMNDELHHTNEEQGTQPPDEGISGLDLHTSDNSQYPGLMAQKLELNFLKNITKGFSPSQEIGSGGYAVVYKGEKEDGGGIAIKGKVDDKQFRNELEHLSTLTHQNIVKPENEPRMLLPEEANCSMDHHTSDNSQYPGLVAPTLELDFLEKITNGFSPSRKIGEGGFATVYKGVKESGGMIAVKKFAIRGEVDDKQFQNEAWHLSTLTHRNIVKFVGYCYDVKKELRPYQGHEVMADEVYMLLCFEYLPIGSLDKHLKDASSGLTWPQRYKIIEGICNGLHYLHEGREGFPVIHRDLKPANILLDENMVPKIADFGISRLMGEGRTHTFTDHFIGTWAYLPLEFKLNGTISKNLDIFSLGVIIIEIINGQKMYCDNNGTTNEEIVEAVLQKWRPRLQKEGSMEENHSQLYACIMLGLECMDIDPQKRPTTKQILHTLNKQNQFHRGESILLGSTSGMPSLEMYGEDSQQNDTENKSKDTSPPPTELSLQFLKDITDNFCNEQVMGGGAYKGIYPSGEIIAVKKILENTRVGERQFRITVGDLSALQHKNVAKLKGYCHEVHRKVERYGNDVLVDDNLLCYEYQHSESLDKYIYDKSPGLDWNVRLKIIKGICEGLHFLQKGSNRSIIHLNLKPSSIFLDEKMVPKIANYGPFWLYDQEYISTWVQDASDGLQYMAPEYLYCREISLEALLRSDLYSLGILIMEVTTGEKSSANKDVLPAWNFIRHVRENWRYISYITTKYPSLGTYCIKQVKSCIEVGLKCADICPSKRPPIGEVVSMLVKISQLLDVYPSQLCIPFKPNKLVSCPLHLTNKTDDYVAIMLRLKNTKRYMTRLPLCCVVPPSSTYIVVVTTRKQDKQPSQISNEFLTLESTIVGEVDLNLKNVNSKSASNKYRNCFKKAKETTADKVHELTLKVVSDSEEEVSFGEVSLQLSKENMQSHKQKIQFGIEIISEKSSHQLLSVDIHPTEPWIMTSHHTGHIFIWDYHTHATVKCFEVGTAQPVCSAKFIEREKWLVAGDGDGNIYVYSYDTKNEVKIFEAHDNGIESLAVHPTSPFVLSSSESDDHLIKLWDWDKDWECTQTFKGHSDRVTQITFNPMDSNSFASASLDRTIKIWNLSSSKSKITLREHPDSLQCAHYFMRDKCQFLITGFWDGTAQIWNLQTERCVKTLKGHTDRICCVYRHPELPILITGSLDGTLRLWDSITCRLENIIGLNLGAVYALGYIKGLRRIVVGCHQGIAILEINFL